MYLRKSICRQPVQERLSWVRDGAKMLAVLFGIDANDEGRGSSSRAPLDTDNMNILNYGRSYIIGLLISGVAHSQTGNTAVGLQALGLQVLNSSDTGTNNTAVGCQAVSANTSGANNSGLGFQALYANTSGSGNTGEGMQALYSNTIGGGNTANGFKTLYSNTTAYANTATGFSSLFSNVGGANNTADGYEALYNDTGGSNTAVGYEALINDTTGANNVGIGVSAGSALSTGSYDIYIGNAGGGSSESNTIRIGASSNQTATYVAGIYGVTSTGGTAVYINSSGQLGTVTSSRRFKTDIRDMGSTSEAILALRPVTFRYKPEIDPAGTPQFGLVAEEVEKVAPELVIHDDENKAYSVRYEAVNAMLLNEFQKQHEQISEQAKIIAEQAAQAEEQRKEIEALKARLSAIDALVKSAAKQ